MVQFNLALREINCKIVYFGPGLSGKTTNLEIVHQKAPQDSRGELTSIATESDRTLFFDFMPLNLGKVSGMQTKFQLYTVPGQIYYNSTRKLVLRGADGVVFVADSTPGKMEENIESLDNLEECLRNQDRTLDDMPHVIQFNKRDIEGATSLEEMQQSLNRYGAMTFEAVAASGEGVIETFKGLSNLVLEKIKTMPDKRSARSASGSSSDNEASPASAVRPSIAASRPGAPAVSNPPLAAPPARAFNLTGVSPSIRTAAQLPSSATPVRPLPVAGRPSSVSQGGSRSTQEAGTAIATPSRPMARARVNSMDASSRTPSRSADRGSRGRSTSTGQRLMVASNNRRRQSSAGPLVWLMLGAALVGGVAFAVMNGLI
jgi:signal recognition particle receptor subunit beta